MLSRCDGANQSGRCSAMNYVSSYYLVRIIAALLST